MKKIKIYPKTPRRINFLLFLFKKNIDITHTLLYNIDISNKATEEIKMKINQMDYQKLTRDEFMSKYGVSQYMYYKGYHEDAEARKLTTSTGLDGFF